MVYNKYYQYQALVSVPACHFHFAYVVMSARVHYELILVYLLCNHNASKWFIWYHTLSYDFLMMITINANMEDTCINYIVIILTVEERPDTPFINE